MSQTIPKTKHKVLKLGPAIWLYENIEIKDRTWYTSIERVPVRVMAVAEGYAMVRRKGCKTFVVPVKDIEAVTSAKP